MRFPTKNNKFVKFLKPSPLQPILPLVPEILPSREEEKGKYLSFELKSRAGQPTGSTTYKKYIRVFEEGTPQQWIDLVKDVTEIWTQNTINGPTDRTATLRALLKGESLTAFDTALEDVRINPDLDEAPLPLSNEIIEEALAQVATTVFPHRALETQKLWMNRGMKKPSDLSARKTAAAITRINNCLPMFPLGTPESKFTEPELVGLLEWSLPQTWRNKFDLDGYIPTQGTKAKLILECEAIERSEVTKKEAKNDNNNNNKNNKNSNFGKSRAGAGNRDRRDSTVRTPTGNGRSFFCKNCGPNRTHTTDKCYFLNKTQRTSGDTSSTVSSEAKKKKPFSRRTFRKEVNTLARKAVKKNALGHFKSALKKAELAKESKEKKNKKISDSDDSESEDSMSINYMEKTIPRKTKQDPKNSKNSPKDNDETFLEQVNKMQLDDDDDDYELVDSGADALSIDEESI